MQLFAPNRSYLSYVFLQVGKIKVTAKRGLKILWTHCQNSVLIMINRIRKVRLGVDIIKKILDSCKFISDRIRPCLQQPISNLNSVFPFSLFLARGRGRRSIEKPLLLCTIIFFFPSRVYCHVLFHTRFCSAARNWRELYKNLNVLSSVDAYT